MQHSYLYWFDTSTSDIVLFVLLKAKEFRKAKSMQNGELAVENMKMGAFAGFHSNYRHPLWVCSYKC